MSSWAAAAAMVATPSLSESVTLAPALQRLDALERVEVQDHAHGPLGQGADERLRGEHPVRLQGPLEDQAVADLVPVDSSHREDKQR